jgi:hypothetical protein
VVILVKTSIRNAANIQSEQVRQLRITQNGGSFVQKRLQWKSNRYYIFWVCVSRLRYPVCNAHAPYCYLWHVGLYSIFFTLSQKRHYLKKKGDWTSNVLFFLQLLSETFSHSKKKWERHDKKKLHVLLLQRSWHLIFSYLTCWRCKLPEKLHLVNRQVAISVTLFDVEVEGTKISQNFSNYDACPESKDTSRVGR